MRIKDFNASLLEQESAAAAVHKLRQEQAKQVAKAYFKPQPHNVLMLKHVRPFTHMHKQESQVAEAVTNNFDTFGFLNHLKLFFLRLKKYNVVKAFDLST